MKTINFSKTVCTAIICLSLFACKSDKKENKDFDPDKTEETASNEEIKFKESEIQESFIMYLKLKDALVEEKPIEEIHKIIEAFSEIAYSPVKDYLVEMSSIKEMDRLRKFFYEISKQIKPTFRNTIESGEIYQQYCPMAFDNQGAFWFSDSKEILNPYFGEKMLRCGSVQETIK